MPPGMEFRRGFPFYRPRILGWNRPGGLVSSETTVIEPAKSSTRKSYDIKTVGEPGVGGGNAIEPELRLRKVSLFSLTTGFIDGCVDRFYNFFF